jgi:hypothetical protein
VRERERDRNCGSLYRFYSCESICLFYKTSLRARASYVVYANAQRRINSLYHFSLYENICLSYKTSTLPCNCFHLFGGGGYDSILWLSFAQQKLNGSGMEKDLGCKAPSLLTVRVTRGGDQPYPEHNASYNARVVKSYKTTSSLLKCFLLLWKNTLHAITPVL